MEKLALKASQPVPALIGSHPEYVDTCLLIVAELLERQDKHIQ